MGGPPAGRPASGAPGSSPAEQLQRIARLHWLLFGCGVGLLILGVALGLELLGTVSLLLVGFGLGILLAAFLISGYLLRCPFCGAALRVSGRRRCPSCGAPIAEEPAPGPVGKT